MTGGVEGGRRCKHLQHSSPRCNYCPPEHAAASAFSLCSRSLTLALYMIVSHTSDTQDTQEGAHLDWNKLRLRHDFCEVAAVAVYKAKLGKNFFEGRHVRSPVPLRCRPPYSSRAMNSCVGAPCVGGLAGIQGGGGFGYVAATASAAIFPASMNVQRS